MKNSRDAAVRAICDSVFNGKKKFTRMTPTTLSTLLTTAYNIGVAMQKDIAEFVALGPFYRQVDKYRDVIQDRGQDGNVSRVHYLNATTSISQCPEPVKQTLDCSFLRVDGMWFHRMDPQQAEYYERAFQDRKSK